jgi:hypothetical protein
VINASTTATVDLIDMIIVIAGPIVAMTTGIDVVSAATTAVMIGATTTVAMIMMTGVTTTGVITATTNTTIAEMTDVMIDVARTTTIERN